MVRAVRQGWQAMESSVMTLDLEALEALLAKTTPGPWRRDYVNVVTDNDDGTVCRVALIRCVSDADAVIAAINALPELIARMRELEQQVQACGIRPRDKSIAPEAHVDGKWCRDLRCSRCYSYKTAIELENHNHALAMRERCAHVCDEIADIHPEARTVATICAAAIRAMET